MIPKLSEPLTIGGVHIRWITIVTILLAIGVFAALTLLLTKTTIGLQMRAASIDSQTARLLGVRANAVITAAVVVSGVIAAIVAVILPMAVPERLLVAPDYALRETIIVLVGVVVGGIDRLGRRRWAGSRWDSRSVRSQASCRAAAPGRLRAASTSIRPCSCS